MTRASVLAGPVHHVGYVVRAIDGTEALFRELGYERVSALVEDDLQDAAIVFLARLDSGPGEPLVELVSPRSDRSPVAAFARESRFRIHHVCHAVDDVDAAVARLRPRFTQVTPIVHAPAIGGQRITFMFSRETGLFELVERPPF